MADVVYWTEGMRRNGGKMSVLQDSRQHSSVSLPSRIQNDTLELLEELKKFYLSTHILSHTHTHTLIHKQTLDCLHEPKMTHTYSSVCLQR